MPFATAAARSEAPSDEELRSDVGRGMAVGHKAQHLLLASRELRAHIGPPDAYLSAHVTFDAPGEDGLATRSRHDCREEPEAQRSTTGPLSEVSTATKTRMAAGVSSQLRP